jgi:uncharacterized protein (DUF362 family)
MKQKLNRRDFIRNTALGVTALSVGGHFNGFAASPTLPVLVQGKGQGVRQDLLKSLQTLLEPLGGIGAYVKKGQTVLIKPNLGFPNRPEVRATTSPTLVAALVRLVQSCEPKKVVIADYPCRDIDKIKTINGYEEALKDLPVELLIATEENQFVEADVPRGKTLKKTKILRALLDADIHIAIPVAKSHGGATFTGVLKGMMGVIWDRKCFHKELDLHQAIADLNTRIRPHLSILEGIEIMADEGPVGPGTLISADTLIAGIDPVAVDAAGVRLAPLFGKKVEPKQVQHLALAAQQNVGKLDLPAASIRTVEFRSA